MKNTSWFYCSLAVSAILGACSNSDQDQSPESTVILSNEQEDAVPEKPPLSNSILEQSIQADQKLDNYTANLKITDTLTPAQSIETGDQSVKITEGTLSYRDEPRATYTNLARYPVNDKDGEEEPQETYGILQESGGLWVNVNSAGWDEVKDLSLFENDIISYDFTPHQQLQLLNSISNYVSVSEYDGLYVLSVEASGDELREMAVNMDLVDESLLEEKNIEINEQFQVAQLDYMLFINKETLLLEKTNSVFEVVLEGDEQDWIIRKDLSLTRSNVNNKDGIRLPSIVDQPQKSKPM